MSYYVKRIGERLDRDRIGKIVTLMPIKTNGIETDKTYHFVGILYSKCEKRMRKDGTPRRVPLCLLENDTLIT